MSVNVLEVVVDAVESDCGRGRGGAHMRRTARYVMQPIANKGVEVGETKEKDRPIVLAITGSGP